MEEKKEQEFMKQSEQNGKTGGNGKKQLKLSKKEILVIALISLAVGCVAFCITKLFSPETKGYERQHQEEDLADQFIDDLMNSKAAGESTKADTEKNNDETDDPSESSGEAETQNPSGGSTGGWESSVKTGEWSDDVWFHDSQGTVYTPDYARGYAECVLEVPKDNIRIKRPVYNGSREDLEWDLQIWMVTVARTGMKLGETHYVIYGHNSLSQNLSFNRLENIRVGEHFTLTGEAGVFDYEVTYTGNMTREAVSSDIVYNYDIGSDKCHIATCSNSVNGLDFVVEGTLQKVYTLQEWKSMKQ